MMVTRKRLAERRLDHEWPAEVQQLWHAARGLADAILTTEEAYEGRTCQEGEGLILMAADHIYAALNAIDERAAILLRAD